MAVAGAGAGSGQGWATEHMADLEGLVLILQDRIKKLEKLVTTQHKTVKKQGERVGELEDFVTTQHETILKQSEQLELTMEYVGVVPQRIQLYDGVNLRNVRQMISRGDGFMSVSPLASRAASPPASSPASPSAINKVDEVQMPPPPPRQAREGSVQGGGNGHPKEQDSATAPASQPGVVLIPPTPQTSQEAAAYAAVPLVPVRIESTASEPKAGEEATGVARAVADAEAHPAEVAPSAAQGQDGGNRTRADDGETVVGKDWPAAMAMAVVAATANVIRTPPQDLLLPPAPPSPIDSPHSPRSRSRSRTRLSPVPPQDLRRSPRHHPGSPGPSKRSLSEDEVEQAGKGKRAKRA